jgi:RNA polymerase sigma factor (sigma-70 family)
MTKDELKKYQAIKKERKQIADYLQQLELELDAPGSPRLDGMPFNPSSNKNPMASKVATKVDLLRLYESKAAELDAALLAIEKAIDTLDHTERMLMRYHYIDGLTWEDVAVEIGYSWRQTHRLHAKALRQIEDK